MVKQALHGHPRYLITWMANTLHNAIYFYTFEVRYQVLVLLDMIEGIIERWKWSDVWLTGNYCIRIQMINRTLRWLLNTRAITSYVTVAAEISLDELPTKLISNILIRQLIKSIFSKVNSWILKKKLGADSCQYLVSWPVCTAFLWKKAILIWFMLQDSIASFEQLQTGRETWHCLIRI